MAFLPAICFVFRTSYGRRGNRRSKQLKRFQAKWAPVRIKKTRQNKNLEPRFDSIETEKALVWWRPDGIATKRQSAWPAPSPDSETNWAGVTVKWDNRSQQSVLHNDMQCVGVVSKK
jgi:hypothetical protein